MPMIAERPVVSRISDEIFARLRKSLLEEADGAYSFCDVIRPKKLAEYTPQHGLIVLTRGDAVRVNNLDCPGNPPSIAWQQTFLIRCHIAPSENDETHVDYFEEQIEAQIQDAIVNSDMWYSFDSNAIDAEFGPMLTVSGDGGYDGIAVPVLVTYRVSEGNPYTVRA